ncbi:MAG: hypothetical protein IKO32_04150 [Lachnospiraceae bacterium]|nr:hypothetical protein [Lachnospiraceae bacterium]
MKEPLNLKLLMLFLLKKIWILLCASVLMAILFGGIYYLKNYVFAPAPDYVATSQLYLTYADDVRLENVYINDYTWQVLADSDACIEEAKKNLSFDADRQYLIDAANACLESDVRLVTVTAVDKDPNRAVEVANAYEVAIQKLGERMVDVDEVQIFTSANSAVKKEWDNRTLRMSITGAVVGFAAALVFLLFAFAVDDSVYLPENTYIRYSIQTIACFDKAGNTLDKWKKRAAEINLEKLLEGKNKVYLSDISGTSCIDEKKIDDMKQHLGEAGKILVSAPGVLEDADAAAAMKDGDGVIVLIKAGAGNGKQIEEAIRFLNIQEIEILGAILYDADKKSLACYQRELHV